MLPLNDFQSFDASTMVLTLSMNITTVILTMNFDLCLNTPYDSLTISRMNISSYHLSFAGFKASQIKSFLEHNLKIKKPGSLIQEWDNVSVHRLLTCWTLFHKWTHHVKCHKSRWKSWVARFYPGNNLLNAVREVD